jgi:hypothetical protein
MILWACRSSLCKAATSSFSFGINDPSGGFGFGDMFSNLFGGDRSGAGLN